MPLSVYGGGGKVVPIESVGFAYCEGVIDVLVIFGEVVQKEDMPFAAVNIGMLPRLVDSLTMEHIGSA